MAICGCCASDDEGEVFKPRSKRWCTDVLCLLFLCIARLVPFIFLYHHRYPNPNPNPNPNPKLNSNQVCLALQAFDAERHNVEAALKP